MQHYEYEGINVHLFNLMKADESDGQDRYLSIGIDDARSLSFSKIISVPGPLTVYKVLEISEKLYPFLQIGQHSCQIDVHKETLTKECACVHMV